MASRLRGVALRVLFAGTPDFAVPTLAAIHAAGHEIVAVITQPDRPAGRGRRLQPSAVKTQALDYGLTVLTPARCSAVNWADYPCDVMVVVAYGLLLPQAVLDHPKYGCLNVHPSALPAYRGAAPIQHTLLNGESTTAVSIIRMVLAMDAGPIVAQTQQVIGPKETSGTLHTRFAQVGAEMIVSVLARLEATGEIDALPQVEADATYAPKIQKAQAALKWCLSARALDQQVRAFSPWPVAYTAHEGVRIRIHQAIYRETSGSGAPGTLVAIDDAAVWVATGEGELGLQCIQRPGGRVVSAVAYARTAPDWVVGHTKFIEE